MEREVLVLPYITHILAFIAAFHIMHVYGKDFSVARYRLCFCNVAYAFNVLTLCMNLLFFYLFTDAGLTRGWSIPVHWTLYHTFNGALLFFMHVLIGFEMQKKTGRRYWSG